VSHSYWHRGIEDPECDVRIPYCVDVAKLRPYSIRLRLQELHEIWSQEFDPKLRQLIDGLLSEAKIGDASDIDYLLLAGGGSRSILFCESTKKLLAERAFRGDVLTSKDVPEHRHFDYDVAVGFGCAYWAKVMLSANAQIPRFIAPEAISCRIDAAGKEYWALVVPARQTLREEGLEIHVKLSRPLGRERSSVELRFFEGTPEDIEGNPEAYPLDQANIPCFTFNEEAEITELSIKVRELKGLARCSVTGFVNDGNAKSKREVKPRESARHSEQEAVLDHYSAYDFYSCAVKRYFGLDLGTSKTILSLYTAPA